MRLRHSLFLFCLAALPAACGSGGQGPAHPAGWTAQGTGAGAYWSSPQDPQERYSVSSSPNSGGATLADMASQITTDTVLRYRGAKLLKAEPFPPCPGEAGLQTFRLTAPHGTERLEVAFTQWNGTSVIASYRRPERAADDPAALDAVRKSVCSPAVGG